MFNKEEYWKNRNNTVKSKDGDGVEVEVSKPIRGQGAAPSLIVSAKPSPAQLGFTADGQLIIKNRAFRRKRVILPGAVNAAKAKKARKKNVKRNRANA